MLAAEHLDAVERLRRDLTHDEQLELGVPLVDDLEGPLRELGALAAVWEAECDRLAALLDDALDLECPTCGT